MFDVMTLNPSGSTEQLFDARELYELILRTKCELKGIDYDPTYEDFRHWIKYHIKKAGLILNRDYTRREKNSRQVSGTKYSHEYYLKEIAVKKIVARQTGEIGLRALNYFLEQVQPPSLKFLERDMLQLQDKYAEVRTRLSTLESMVASARVLSLSNFAVYLGTTRKNVVAALRKAECLLKTEERPHSYFIKSGYLQYKLDHTQNAYQTFVTAKGVAYLTERVARLSCGKVYFKF